PGGTITLGETDMIIQGGLVRNNGTISSINGNIIVDYGATLRGSGTNDVNAVILRNGGQRFSGNSPGPSFNRNVDLTNAVVTGVDINRASGTAGADWGVSGYGAAAHRWRAERLPGLRRVGVGVGHDAGGRAWDIQLRLRAGHAG